MHSGSPSSFERLRSRRKRVSKNAVDLIAGRQFRRDRLNPIPGPAELGRHGGATCTPFVPPSIAKAGYLSPERRLPKSAVFDESANFQANFYSIFNGLL